MKTYNYILLAIVVSGLIGLSVSAQTVKNDLIVTTGYFNNNNQVQYLKASTKSKIDGRFQQVPGIPLKFYISADSPVNLLGEAVTNRKGEATLFIPATAKTEWDKSSGHHFVVVSTATKEYDAVRSDWTIVKARLHIDTAEDRKVVVHLMEWKDTVWTPVKGVDCKIAVRRLDGDLNISETPTYTSDSLGVVMADFKRDSLPGDAKGLLTLVAKVEDNDTYGNLMAEMPVRWGTRANFVSQYDRRTLFARRGRSPIWFEFIAYSIVVVVWGILLYLFGQIRKLRKAGREPVPANG